MTPSGLQGEKGLYFMLRRAIRNVNGVHLVFDMVVCCIFGKGGTSLVDYWLKRAQKRQTDL